MVGPGPATVVLTCVAALLGGCAASRPAAGTQAPPLAQAAASEIPLVPYVGRLRSVRGVVAGRTVDLLFDSGGGWTFLSPELARHAGCEPAGRAVGLRMTGERIEAPLCASVPVQLGGYVHMAEPAAV